MDIKEYIKELKRFTSEKGISIYDYYYLYVETLKSGERFELPDFELRNPFLKASDIQKLLLCREERIAEYYAYVMSKIIDNNDILSRDDIKDVLDGLFDSGLSRDNISEAIDEELDKNLSKKDINEIILDELNKQSIDEEKIVFLDEEDPKLSREDITKILVDSIDNTESKVVITSINPDMANYLDGFVVVREEKTGIVNLYHNDSNTNTLSGKQVYKSNQLAADTGFYVNIEEYVDRLLDIIMAVYPTMEEVAFVKDGEVKQFNEVLEEVFKIVRDAKAIRFGKELKGKEINTYEDLINIPTKKEEYQGKQLQTGMYVRRDILTNLFNQYRVKITYKEEKEKSALK